ncbi:MULTISPECIES: sensor histidine kinase [Paraburkholderia]|uniref:sensor histidine kinase n=1 Tax=Paraburkholderia TaxID=1822464 RepID=UPI00225C1768|nr:MULTISPECIES: sensor histidine kinase [Paraburkholderia]MCX4164594.1 sensor histidine kinase [Paraburkholderia megapolitana]MDN7160087.1 ATP-binding protein [Paraburkholderia sp. CHISQ3]MDQ6497134.1 ATP-binding protein [Paraburkholderia megapolitana]
MSIYFKARVLLELGAELISSDAVALYELIKNGIDAGSKRVEIDVNIIMQPSSQRELESKWSTVDTKDWNKEEFSFDLAEHIESTASEAARNDFLTRMRDVSGPSQALLALKAACFDGNRIQVIDSGHGMDDDALRTCYLTVGTPSRLKQKKLALASDKASVIVPLGEKGIGRLAAMRIGHHVNVASRASTKPAEFELELDWRPVFRDPDLDAGALQFEPKPRQPSLSTSTGTVITIRDIQSDWTIDKLTELADADLSKLADPFKVNYANQFLRIKFQGEDQTLVTAFRSSNLKFADAECTISFKAGSPGDSATGQIAGMEVTTVYRRFDDKAEKLVHHGSHLRDSVSHPPGRRTVRAKASDRLPRSDEVIAALSTLGDFEAKFWWFNRGRLQKEDKELWASGLRKFVRDWSGGLLVYRDGFRVYPYGSAADDWLDLDRKALASSAYKLNRAQIIGYLRISSHGNPNLQDQTNREGFRDCPQKEALRRLLRQAIISDCKTFLERVDKENKAADEETIRDIDTRIVDASDAAAFNLKRLRDRVPGESAVVQTILVELAEVQDAWDRAKAALEAKDSEVEKYSHLAGVGLMVELLAHELARSTDAALELLKDKRTVRDPAKLEMLEAQLKTLNKRVRVIDELSIPGRQRKAILDITSLVSLVKEFYETKLHRHGIQFNIEVNPKKIFSRKVEKGQIIQIFDNLLNNSTYWLVRRLDRKKPPEIRALINPQLGTIQFTDTGPGIPDTIGGRVFDPFYSTKPKEGRGLGLYIAKRLASENDATLELLPAHEGVHHGFELRFAEK